MAVGCRAPEEPRREEGARRLQDEDEEEERRAGRRALIVASLSVEGDGPPGDQAAATDWVAVPRSAASLC